MSEIQFKNEIIAELDIDYQDDQNKATLTTSLNMIVYVREDDKWKFIEKICIYDKSDLESLQKFFEKAKNKYLNKPEKVEYSSDDPDDIPF
jgi:hypothetical protein